MVILTSYNSLTNPDLVSKLSMKGIKKFIAYEISNQLVKKKVWSAFQRNYGRSVSNG